MNRNLIISIFSYFLIVCLIPVLFFNIRKTVKKMGKCILPFSVKSYAVMIGIYIFDFILLAILIFRDFGYASFILAACCILSFYITSSDTIKKKYYGVYEKGLIASNSIIFFDDIISFPVFNLSLEEREKYSRNSIVIITEKKGKVELIFSSEELCSQVVKQLISMGIIKSE